MSLAFCHRCGAIFNRHHDPALVAYGPSYENSLHWSPLFRAYAQALARRLVDTYGLRGKTVVEIGSGQGEFLSLLCQLGDNEGVGYDPGGDGDAVLPAAPQDGGGRLRLVATSADDGIADADFVCCRHVLEHVESPRLLVQRAFDSLVGRQGVAYFEVPDAAHMLRAGSVYDVVYEHCSYLAEPCLRLLFEKSGFEVIDVGTSFGGQYLYLEASARRRAKCSSPRPRATARPAALEELADLVSRFSEQHDHTMARWAERLAAIEEAAREAVVWGVGSKGVTFLNLVPGAGAISRVVDVNPRKQGKFVPVTAHPVVAPTELAQAPPDVVIVMNAIYEDEVREQLRALGVGAEVVRAL